MHLRDSGVELSGLAAFGNRMASVGERRSEGGSLETGLVRMGLLETAEPVKPAAALWEGVEGDSEPVKPAAVLAKETG